MLLVAVFFGIVMVIYGALLAWKPEQLLKFHDTFIDRTKWGKNATWRNEVDKPGAKLVGIVFVLCGVFVTVSFIRMIIIRYLLAG